MKLTIANTLEIGKRCKIFDADDDEVLDVVEANTETGSVLRHKREGGLVVAMKGTCRTVKIRETRPAPLRVEWIDTDAKETDKAEGRSSSEEDRG